MLEISLVFVCVIIVLLLLYFEHIRSGKKKNVATVPGMDASDETHGNFPDIQESGGMHQFLVKLHNKYGPIASFWYGTEYCISIGNAEHMKKVKHLFDRPAKLFELVEPQVGKKSIAFANGEDGKRRHKIMVEAMSVKVSERLMPGMVEIVKELVQRWLEFSEAEHIPLHENMMTLAIRMISKSQLGAFFKNDENVRKFQKHYMLANELQEALLVGKLETGKMRKEWQTGLDQLHETVKEIINSQKKAREDGDYEIAPLLDAIIDTAITEIESGEKLSQELGDVTGVAVAGFHTTGTVLTWFLYFLIIHPDIQEKMHQELINVLGDSDINETTIKKLTYTWQVLEETLRISLTATFAVRVSNDKQLTIGGHLIPAGTPMVLPLGVLLSDEQYFPNIDKFDPDRFSHENAKKIPAIAFPTFGVGARRCPGYHFSRYEVITAVSILCKRYEFLPALDNDFSATPVYGFVTKPESEIWIKIRKRN